MSLIEDDVLPDILRERWPSFLFAGVIFISTGVFAAAAPLTSGITLTTLIGTALAIAGLFQGIHAFAIRHWGWFAASLASGILLFAAGLFLLLAPLSGVAVLTLALALVLGASGLAEMASSLFLRPLPQWKWQAASGLASFLSGVYIWTRAATAPAGIVGLAAGVGLFTTGITLIRLGLAGRRAARQHIA